MSHPSRRNGGTALHLVRRKSSVKGTGEYDTEKLIPPSLRKKNTVKYRHKTPHRAKLSPRRQALVDRARADADRDRAEKTELVERLMQAVGSTKHELESRSLLVLRARWHAYLLSQRAADGKSPEERVLEEMS